MIWIQNEKDKIIYPAKATTKNSFNEVEMCGKSQINCLEYLFNPNSIKRLVGGSDSVSFEPYFNKDATCVINGLEANFQVGRYGQTVLEYLHPLYVAIKVLNELRWSKEAYELLDVFNQFAVSDTKRELDEFKKAKKIIESLSKSSVDSEIFKASVQKMWPVFGYFATEIFGNIEFVPVENLQVYTYDEINIIKDNLDFCNNRSIIIDQEQKQLYDKILSAEQSARNNSKVLSLARKVNERSRG